MDLFTSNTSLAAVTFVVLVALGYFTFRKAAERTRMAFWPLGGAILGALYGLRATDLGDEHAWILPALGAVLGLCTGAAFWLVDGTRVAVAARGESAGEPFLALTSFLLCWAPFFGLLLTGTAVYKNRGVRGWVRILSVIGLFSSIAIHVALLQGAR
jgi:hypothetical protein